MEGVKGCGRGVEGACPRLGTCATCVKDAVKGAGSLAVRWMWAKLGFQGGDGIKGVGLGWHRACGQACVHVAAAAMLLLLDQLVHLVGHLLEAHRKRVFLAELHLADEDPVGVAILALAAAAAVQDSLRVRVQAVSQDGGVVLNRGGDLARAGRPARTGTHRACFRHTGLHLHQHVRPAGKHNRGRVQARGCQARLRLRRRLGCAEHRGLGCRHRNVHARWRTRQRVAVVSVVGGRVLRKHLVKLSG